MAMRAIDQILNAENPFLGVSDDEFNALYDLCVREREWRNFEIDDRLLKEANEREQA